MVLILTNVIQDIIFKDRVEIEFRSNCLKSCAIDLSNALHLNPSKFSLLVVRTSSLLSHFSSFNILLNHSQIPLFPSIKILGVHFDSSWTFSESHRDERSCSLLMSPPFISILSYPINLTKTRLVSPDYNFLVPST